jgi:hypothetical protein
MKYSLIKRFSFALFIVAILTSVPTLSFGQWILGAKAGYVNSKLTGGDVYGGMNYKGGIEAGVVISKKLKVDFGFESGIFYSMAGVNQKYIEQNIVSYQDPVTQQIVKKDSTFRHTSSLSLSYIKVPLMLRKSISIKGKNLYPYHRKISITDIDIMIGPYVSYLLSASATLDTKVAVTETRDGVPQPDGTKPEGPIKPEDTYHKTFGIGQGIKVNLPADSSVPGGTYIYQYLPKRADLSNGLSKIDVGVVAAVGLSIELSSSSKLTIGGNYSMGLLSIDKEYFSNLVYTVTPGGSTDIGTGTPVSISSKATKMDIKNTSIGAYIGFVKYLR